MYNFIWTLPQIDFSLLFCRLYCLMCNQSIKINNKMKNLNTKIALFFDMYGFISHKIKINVIPYCTEWNMILCTHNNYSFQQKRANVFLWRNTCCLENDKYLKVLKLIKVTRHLCCKNTWKTETPHIFKSISLLLDHTLNLFKIDTQNTKF